MVGKTVSVKFGLAEEIFADLHLTPEVIDTQSDGGQKHVDDPDPEKGTSVPIEGECGGVVFLPLMMDRLGTAHRGFLGWR